jgi:hypothetical protein
MVRYGDSNPGPVAENLTPIVITCDGGMKTQASYYA